MSLDHEQAGTTFVMETFPKARIHSCLFHLENLKKKRTYNTDTLAVWYITVLVFVAYDDVIGGLEEYHPQ